MAVTFYRLRLELLAAWTNTVKRIGMRIIEYLVMVFKPDYTMEEVSHTGIMYYCQLSELPSNQKYPAARLASTRQRNINDCVGLQQTDSLTKYLSLVYFLVSRTGKPNEERCTSGRAVG